MRRISTWPPAAAVALLALCTPSASARWLSVSSAEARIAAFEKHAHPRQLVTVGPCRRHGPRRVSCVVVRVTALEHGWMFSTFAEAERRKGRVRVVPGWWEEGQSALSPPLPAAPAPAELAGAEAVASSYWGRLPACGHPTVQLASIAPYAGQALEDSCTIDLSAALDWDDAFTLCEVLTHEWGHLVLGVDYFATSNPSDPAHSPDPTSIMFHAPPPTFAPCEAWAASLS